MTNGELMTVADVARMLDCTPAWVRQVVRAGRLHATTVTRSGIRLFTEGDVADYQRRRAAAGRVASAA